MKRKLFEAFPWLIIKHNSWLSLSQLSSGAGAVTVIVTAGFYSWVNYFSFSSILVLIRNLHIQQFHCLTDALFFHFIAFQC